MSAALTERVNERWWQRFFDDDFAQLWLSDDDPVEREGRTHGLVRLLDLRAGSRLFDQCCGVGRVAAPLVERGVHVVGVDGAEPYVLHARARCEALSAAARGDFHYEHADAFTYVPPQPCDAAINWYTSFGYADDDAANGAMLRCAHDALRPGGLFALDYPDMERVRERFLPRSERRRVTPRGTFVAVRDAALDERRQMLVDRWTFVDPSGETRVRHGETRLYSRTDLQRLLSGAGFEVLREVACDEVGYPTGAGRSIWLARRPASSGWRAPGLRDVPR